jgi:hypothetical protein
MKINIDEYKLQSIIKDKLNNKKPFLVTRFGEGEMRVFEGGHELKWIMNNMIGYVPDEKIMDEIKLNMEKSIINSDITGLPSYKGLISEEEVIKSSIDNLYKKMYSVFRETFKKYNTNESNFDYCDVNVHSKFFHKNLFDGLLKNLDELTIITCRDISDDLKKFYNIKKIIHYKIPPEFRFEDDPSKVKFNFYPEIHTQIKNSILNTNNTGKLCLYGAGIIGKDLGYYFKQSGGVAFDIGSIFDHWSGKVTRGPGKGRNKYVESPLRKIN